MPILALFLLTLFGVGTAAVLAKKPAPVSPPRPALPPAPPDSALTPAEWAAKGPIYKEILESTSGPEWEKKAASVGITEEMATKAFLMGDPIAKSEIFRRMKLHPDLARYADAFREILDRGIKLSTTIDFSTATPTVTGGRWIRPGRWYRVKARILKPCSAEQVRAAFEATGFARTQLASMDPTDPYAWTFIAQATVASPSSSSLLSGVTYQEVQEPPSATPKPASPSDLDVGIPYDEAHTVAFALAHETDARHLASFAETLLPDYPVAAGLIAAKARLVALSSKGAPNTAGLVSLVFTARSRKPLIAVFDDDLDGSSHLEATTFKPFLKPSVKLDPSAAKKAILAAKKMKVSNPILALAALTRGLGRTVESMWDTYRGLAPAILSGRQLWALATATKLLDQIRREAPPSEAAKELEKTSPVVALVPGLGMGVEVMLQAGAGLALGEPLDAREVDVFPYPRDVATRETIADEAGKVAFDAGLALGYGKSLQDAGFANLYGFTKGATIAEKAAHFSAALARGKNVKRTLTEEIAVGLARLPGEQIERQLRPLLGNLLQNGKLLQMTSAELAARAHVPEIVARAALAAVKELPGKIRVVDPSVVRIFLSKPRPITPALIQLAQAAKRPGHAAVADLGKANEQIRRIASLRSPVAQAARQDIARASHALDRRKWIDTYLAKERSMKESGTVPAAPAPNTGRAPHGWPYEPKIEPVSFYGPDWNWTDIIGGGLDVIGRGGGGGRGGGRGDGSRGGGGGRGGRGGHRHHRHHEGGRRFGPGGFYYGPDYYYDRPAYYYLEEELFDEEPEIVAGNGGFIYDVFDVYSDPSLPKNEDLTDSVFSTENHFVIPEVVMVGARDLGEDTGEGWGGATSILKEALG